MVNSTTDHTVELTPLDLLRYVEGDRPHGVLRLPDGLLCLEFAYNISCDYTHEAGAGNHEMSPVLSSKSLKTLIGMGAVRFTHVDTDTRFFVVMVESDDHPADDPQENITHALKQAFHVHDDDHDGFGGKDPRRVWGEHADSAEVPEAADYFPVND